MLKQITVKITWSIIGADKGITTEAFDFLVFWSYQPNSYHFIDEKWRHKISQLQAL